MSARERGNFWLIICVIAVALAVLVLPLILRHRRASARMATVDAQVTIADPQSDGRSTYEAALYRWPDSEVPRTAERLRDLTAVAIAASTYVAQGAMSGHAPRDAGEITTAIAKRQLIPSEWLTNQSGVLQTAHGTLHIRYDPKLLRIEVISMPATPKDGPALLIRVPDDENAGIGPRYFESMQLEGIVLVPPFAPIIQIVASGWQPKPFKQTFDS
jgi:hypothetical protein